MSNTYFMRFGSGDPRTTAGLNPTFVLFRNLDGTNVTPPPIAQVGTTSGIYGFTFGVTTPIAFIADGATTGLANEVRFVAGQLDPRDSIDFTGQTLVAIGASSVALGTTNVAIGTTAVALLQSASFGALNAVIGTTASSFGTDSADPVSVMGYLKRLQELIEGNATYGRNSNAWSMYSRGSSTLLRTKNIGSDAAGVTKI